MLIIILAFLSYHALATFTFEHGKISPLLHRQALSHLAFHSDPIKLELASLFEPKSVAIVGVEWGEDVQLFARHGYHVYAFEPASKFVEHLQSLVDQNGWNVTIIHAAAGMNNDDRIEVVYEDQKEQAVMKRVDSFVSERLAVLSIDIQGDELNVLQGSTDILEEGLVDSLWVEAIACNPKVERLLEMVDEDYVVFDFVPWGKHLENKSEDVPRGRQSFAYFHDRPSEFKAYHSWMCDLKVNSYHWLQTDFLMVRRELVTNKLTEALGRLAQTHCADGAADCALKNMLDKEEKDEL